VINPVSFGDKRGLATSRDRRAGGRGEEVQLVKGGGAGGKRGGPHENINGKKKKNRISYSQGKKKIGLSRRREQPGCKQNTAGGHLKKKKRAKGQEKKGEKAEDVPKRKKPRTGAGTVNQNEKGEGGNVTGRRKKLQKKKKKGSFRGTLSRGQRENRFSGRKKDLEKKLFGEKKRADPAKREKIANSRKRTPGKRKRDEGEGKRTLSLKKKTLVWGGERGGKGRSACAEKEGKCLSTGGET